MIKIIKQGNRKLIRVGQLKTEFMKTKLLCYLMLIIAINTNAQTFSVSTGTDALGNALSIGSTYPTWQVVSGPNGLVPHAAFAVATYPFSWQATPIAGTNAQWIDYHASIPGNLFSYNGNPGTYVYERTFNIATGTTSLNCNFGVAYDDTLSSLELVPPSGAAIPLTVVTSNPYSISNMITNVITAPIPGSWKIRATVNYIDAVGGFMLSGNVTLANSSTSTCNTTASDFDSLYSGLAANPLYFDHVTLDLQVHSYTLTVASQKTICSIGYRAQPELAARTYEIKITDVGNGSIIYDDFHLFSTTATSYVTPSTTITLNPGHVYKMERIQTNYAGTPSGLGNTIGRLIESNGMPLTFPQTFGNITVIGSDFYDIGFSGTNNFPAIPFIDIRFQNPTGTSPSAPIASNQTMCSGSTVANLVATGQNLQWYTVATNGSALSTNTALVAGNYYVSQTVGGIESPRTMITVTLINSSVTPTFTQITPVCTLTTVSPLPTISNNGITGTWSPAFNNATTPFNITTTTYTFTPNAGQCATTTTMAIQVYPLQDLLFAPITPICAGDVLIPPPNTAGNGTTGTWSPAFNNTTTTTYTFTPDTGYCSVPRTLTITVNPRVTPTFTTIAPICIGGTLSALPTVSNNGITGTWSPALNNTITTSYTFTPTAGQCATTATIRINVYTVVTLYVDADGDGYDNGTFTNCSGVIPTGYSLTTLGHDCDDTNAQINPNHVEVLANGIDDNCDGAIDEVTPNSFLIPSMCGTILTSLWDSIFAYPLSSYLPLAIQGYRFEVTNQTTNAVYTYDTSGPSSFNLFNVPNPPALASTPTYATTYSIRVAVKIGGFWRSYGVPCTVTTPPFPTATISSPTCGSILGSVWDVIRCNTVTNATHYRFRVRLGTTVVGTYDFTPTPSNPSPQFSLAIIPGVTLGNTYTVDVLLEINGVWRPTTEYGSACTISTPACPEPSFVVSPNCGSIINSFWNTIFAQQVFGALAYRFVVTYGANTVAYDPITPTTAVSPTRQFQLREAGIIIPSTTYTIRVDVLCADGTWIQGTQTCNITASATAVRSSASDLAIFEVKAYPNPFAENFKLDINTSSEEQVNVSVFDMLGREIETRQSNLDAMNTLEIGDYYPTGVYNIVVTQGEHVKSLRVIKR